MTNLAPEWVRTSDPVIRSPARYRWTTAPAQISVEETYIMKERKYIHINTNNSRSKRLILVDMNSSDPYINIGVQILHTIVRESGAKKLTILIIYGNV